MINTFKTLPFMWLPYFSVALGSALGGVIRHWLNLRLAHASTPFPLGTLVANLSAAYLIGLFIAFFMANPKISPEWKLILTTGLCGGLSTFSAFSAEVVSLLQQQRYLTALAGIGAHLFGSLILTALGFATWQIIKRVV